MTNPLQSLQTAIVAQLKMDPSLASIEVIEEDRKDLITDIQVAIAKLGVVLVVQTVSVGVSHPNLPGPTFDSIKFTVAVAENVTINRAPGSAQLDALSLAVAVSQCLHNFRPVDVVPFGGYTILAAPNAIEYQQDDAVLAYDVNFFLGNQ